MLKCRGNPHDFRFLRLFDVYDTAGNLDVFGAIQRLKVAIGEFDEAPFGTEPDSLTRVDLQVRLAAAFRNDQRAGFGILIDRAGREACIRRGQQGGDRNKNLPHPRSPVFPPPLLRFARLCRHYPL